MKFKFNPIDTLPPLAWCAQYQAGSDTIVLHHGSSVELCSDGFVEGAWDGDYPSHNYSQATVFCGSAGKIEGSKVRFFSGSDKVSPLFSISKNNTLLVSNSAVFVMAQADEAPDPLYPFYSYDIVAIWRQGLYCQCGELRTNSSIKLNVHFSTIMTLDSSGRRSYDSFPLCSAPTDYAAYHAILLESVKKVFNNGNHSARMHRFQPIAAISKGYDTNASAAVASLAGCQESFSFTDSNESDPTQDSGVENAHALGLTSRLYDRWDYLQNSRLSDAEFSMFTTSVTSPLLAVEEQLAQRILVSGHSGGYIWDQKCSKYYAHNAQSWSRFIPMLSETEFRLRVGFIGLAIPPIASRHNHSITQITNAEVMRPWSVGGEYDRPIPRRIAEEAGIPRELFGMKKMATGYSGYLAPRRFPKKTLLDYRAFVSEQHTSLPPWQIQFWKKLTQLRHLSWRLLRHWVGNQGRIVQSTPLQRQFPFILNAPPTMLKWEFMFLYQWSFEKLKNRYTIHRS